MTATAQKVRLKFRCDQDFDNMSIGANGKPFCEMCQKSLVDFRTKSLIEVVHYTKQNKNVCGILNVEHVEEDSIEIVSFSRVKRLMFLISTLFVTETAYAQHADTSSQETEILIQESEEVTSENEESEYSTPKSTTKSNKIERHISKPYYRFGFFVSKRFPFVTFWKKIYPYTGLMHGSLMW